MNKLEMLNRIGELYNSNVNIIEYLKNMNGNKNNSLEDILISYDFQAGSYTKQYKNDGKLKDKYCKKLSDEISKLGQFNNILEVGVGEATTLGVLLKSMDNAPKHGYGFDISWSRIKYAKRFLKELNIKNVELFTGDLFSMPLKDNSIDIVYTSHSIEPNGGKEKSALEELYRVTNKYLILLEPAYDLASEEAKKRMEKNGYVTRLYETAKELGYNIERYELFGVSVNQLNPTGIMIIKKDGRENTEDPLCCPITKASIEKKNNAYFSEKSLISYPIIDDIPCLLPQNAIITTKFLD